MTEARLAKVLSDGMVQLAYRASERDELDLALWTTVKVRQPHTCKVTGDPIPVGTKAFAPVGNQMYRGHRISAALMEKAIVGWRQEQESQ